MARNTVQFQKGLSEPDFERQYGTEEECRDAVVASRWPKCFECPECGGTRHRLLGCRDLFQCACRRQTSPIAGSIFAATKLPLTSWFRAIHHLTHTKQGISSIELGRRLGVSQTTAWKIKHKLKQVMLERDAGQPMTGGSFESAEGAPQQDAVRRRGRNHARREAGSPENAPGHLRLKMRRVTSFCGHEIAAFAKGSLDPDGVMVSDGLACFGSVKKAGCSHQVIVTGSGPASVRIPAFKWVNTALGNIKSAIIGTYRAISAKHVPRYLAEFEYRFNRRYDLAAMIPRLTWAGSGRRPCHIAC